MVSIVAVSLAVIVWIGTALAVERAPFRFLKGRQPAPYLSEDLNQLGGPPYYETVHCFQADSGELWRRASAVACISEGEGV